MKFLIGSIVIIIGAFLVIKTDWFYNFTGPVDWAERHLGTEGGTRILYKLLGLLLIIGAFLAMTGSLSCIMGKIFNFSTFSTPTPT